MIKLNEEYRFSSAHCLEINPTWENIQPISNSLHKFELLNPSYEIFYRTEVPLFHQKKKKIGSTHVG